MSALIARQEGSVCKWQLLHTPSGRQVYPACTPQKLVGQQLITWIAYVKKLQ